MFHIHNRDWSRVYHFINRNQKVIICTGSDFDCEYKCSSRGGWIWYTPPRPIKKNHMIVLRTLSNNCQFYIRFNVNVFDQIKRIDNGMINET